MSVENTENATGVTETSDPEVPTNDNTNEAEETANDRHARKLANESKKYRQRAQEAESALEEIKTKLTQAETKLENQAWARVEALAHDAGVGNFELLKSLGLTLEAVTDEETGQIADSKVTAVIEDIESDNGISLRTANPMQKYQEAATAAIDEAAFGQYYTDTLWEIGVSPFEFIDEATLEPKPAEAIINYLEELNMSRIRPIRNVQNHRLFSAQLSPEQMQESIREQRRLGVLTEQPARVAPSTEEMLEDHHLGNYTYLKLHAQALKKHFADRGQKWNGLDYGVLSTGGEAPRESDTQTRWNETFSAR